MGAKVATQEIIDEFFIKHQGHKTDWCIAARSGNGPSVGWFECLDCHDLRWFSDVPDYIRCKPTY
jgi:hypothetical protein